MRTAVVRLRRVHSEDCSMASGGLTPSLPLAQELHALGEFLVVKRFQLLGAWQMAVEDDLIIEAEGTTERIGHRPSIET